MSEAIDDVFSVLTVCTGNLARSPLAAQLLTARLAPLANIVTVSSAGTRAVVDDAMTTQAAQLSQKYGGDPTGHRARLLTPDHIEQADLVLTATREHRAAVVSMVPRASRYAFTFTQFARLVKSLDGLGDQNGRTPDQLRKVVQEAAAQRGFVPPPVHPDDDDTEDPYRRSQRTYDAVGASVNTAVTSIAAALLGIPSGTRPLGSHG